MTRFFSIVKVMVKNSIIVNGFNKKRSIRPSTRSSVLPILFCYLVVAISFGFQSYSRMAIDTARAFETQIFVPALLNIIILGFALSFLNSFSLYFLSKDNEVYLSLPIRTTTIFWGRFFSSNFYSLICNASLFIGFYTAYFVVYGFSFYALVACIACIILFTIIYNIFAFVIGNIIGSFCNLAAHRERFSMLSSLFMIAVILCAIIPSMMNQSPETGEGEQAIANYIINSYNQVRWADFLTFIPTKASLTDSPVALLYSSYTLLIDVAALLVGLFFAYSLYIRNILKTVSGHSAKKKANKLNIMPVVEKDLKKYSKRPIRVLVHREVKLLFKSAMLLFNFFFPMIMILISETIFFVVFAVTGQTDTWTLSLMYTIMVVATVLTPSYCSVCLSKEGENFGYIKTLPISTKRLVISKLIPSYLISVIPSIVFSIIALLTFKINFLLPIFGIIFSLIFTLAMNLFDFLIESATAILVWQNEAQYTKRLVITFPHMGMTILYAGLGLLFAMIVRIAGMEQFMSLVFLIPCALILLFIVYTSAKVRIVRNINNL